MKQKNITLILIPIMFSFFAMGFVDVIGTSTNYMTKDFNLSESLSGLLPSLVFFWFLVFSVPTGMLMNKIGRKKTVLLSLIVTALALVIPSVSYNFPMMLVFCCLLGIGNTLMQVSLNPLISGLVSGEKLASSLTFGQFIKAIASFSAPIIASWAAKNLGDWRLLFPIFMAISVITIALLGATKIPENNEKTQTSTFIECFSMLKLPAIFLCFIGILCHVGLDVGVNVSVPKIFEERLGWHLDKAVGMTSLYFAFRTIGAFSGAFILAQFSAKKFYVFSVICITLSLLGFIIGHNETILYIAVALVGFGNSNIFSLFFSKALQATDKQNEVSGLMIMGISGGAIFPLIMGFASDLTQSQLGGILVLCLICLFFILMIPKFETK